MDIISDSLPPLQLPPLQLGQLDHHFRDRPLPLEPSAPREPYTTPTTPQHGERQQTNQPIQPIQPGLSLHQTVEEKSLLSPIIDFQEQLRESVGDETQATITHTAPARALNASNQPSINTLVTPDTNTANHGRTAHLTSAIKISSTEPVGYAMPKYPPILPWTDEAEQKPERTVKSRSSPPPPQQNTKSGKARRKWTAEETRDLLTGCAIHGVGNWKKVLDDERFNFNNRSSVDLKDRFRTCFPTEYKNHFGKKSSNTNGSGKVSDLSNLLVGGEGSHSKGAQTKYKRKNPKKRNSDCPVSIMEKYGCPNSFPKAPRRERKPFTPEEDEALLRGFKAHGALWSKIQGDKSLNLSHRRSTDLRDRFRNAYPDRYEQAGFKARSKNPPKPPRSGPSSVEEVGGDCGAGSGESTSHQIMLLGQSSSSVSPIDEHEQQAYGGQEIVEHLDGFELETLGKSTHLDVDDREDHEDAASGKSDDFSVTTMMQDLLRDNSLREWGDGNDPLGTDSVSLFSSSNHNECPQSTSSMTVEATLAEEFGSNGVTQFDEQSFLSTAAATNNINSTNSKSISGDTSSTHDLVRWEDMVTHPIFVLEASIPPPSAPCPSSHHLCQHLNQTHHSVATLDEAVTLAPLNPQIFGGRGSLSSLGPIGLPSLVANSGLNPPLHLSGLQGIEGFDDAGIIEGVPTGNLNSVSELVPQNSGRDHAALQSRVSFLDEQLLSTDVASNGKRRRKSIGQRKVRKDKDINYDGGTAEIPSIRALRTSSDSGSLSVSKNPRSKKRKLEKFSATISPSPSPILPTILSLTSSNHSSTVSSTLS